MAESNPYESPPAEQKTRSAKVIKRGILMVILLLAPVATLVTFFASCSAAVLISLNGPGLSDVASGVIAYGPTALVLIAMLSWAAWAWYVTRRR